MITVKPVIEDIRDFQRGELPRNAFRIDTPGPINEMKKKAAPIAASLCALLFVTMFAKTASNRMVVVYPPAVFGGFMIGFALLAVHEWLHAVVYPKDARVTIGKVKGKLIFVALASYPMSRARFILMCLLPFVLGIIPLAVFIFSPPENIMLNGLMFGMASIGTVSPYFDVYNVITVLKRSKRKDKISFYEDGLFRISE